MALDTSFTYRLTNQLLGPGLSLDDGRGRLGMAPATGDDGQHWRLVPHGAGKHALRSLRLGECWSLDVDHDRRAVLAPTQDVTGQLWTVIPRADGTVKLTSDFTGPRRSLRADGDTHELRLERGDDDGHHWTLTKLTRIPDVLPVPVLGGSQDVEHTEGLSEPGLYVPPTGTARAVMLFVDFPDAPTTDPPVAGVADHLLGSGRAQRLFHDQSYGQLDLDVTVRSDLGRRQLPKPSTAYSWGTLEGTWESHRDYIADAAGRFPEVDFSAYEIAFIVAPEIGRFPLSPAFIARAGDGPAAPGGAIHHAVTFGADSYTNRFINLVHETGHLLGLPDLYTIGSGAEDSQAGCWDIMSDIFRSVSFMAWHRYKSGWLPPARAVWIAEDTPGRTMTLHPLSRPEGVAMLVLPVDDLVCPTKVFVVELAEPVIGTNGEPWGEGVLVSTVDASIPSGQAPVVVIPHRDSHSDVFGNFFEAPYGVGDVASASEDPFASLTVEVHRKRDTTYEVQVSYHRH
jgi:M6 family metalloprotease-like protein